MKSMRSPLMLLLLVLAGCSSSTTTLRHPETGQTAICSYSGWGWLGAPMAAVAYGECKTKWEEKGYVKEK